MNAPYIKTKNSISKLINTYYLAIIPLIIYGIYKNGYLLYKEKYISFIGIFKPLLICIVAIICGFIVEVIEKKLIKRQRVDVLNSFNILNGLIFALLVPINVNIFIYFLIVIIGLVVVKIITKYINFNEISFIYLAIIVIFGLYNLDLLSNSYEANNEIVWSFMDYLFGRGVGALCCTNNILILLSYFILRTNIAYKKDIPIIILSTITIIISIYGLIFSFNGLIPILFSGFNVFGSVFVATSFLSSSYTKKGKGVYSILIGIVTSILIIVFKCYYAIFISILLVSFASKLFDHLELTRQ